MTDRLRTTDEHRARLAARSLAWGRFYIALILVGLIAVTVRVVHLKTNPDERLAAAAGTTMSSRTELGRRGDLCDRRGRVLATSSIGYRLFVDPEGVDDIDTIAVRIANTLDRDPIAIDRAIQTRLDRRYAPVIDVLQDWEVDAIRAASLPGVGLEPRPVRAYPFGDVAANVVGMVGFEHTGLGGFEQTVESRLAPEEGHLTYLRDVQRRALWIETADYVAAQTGDTVRLSIDLIIQQYAEEALREGIEGCNAGGGRLIVVDTRTGEILALCDMLRERAGWDEQTDDEFRDIHPALGRNRCVTDQYEPGSTFKPFVWATAIHLGVTTPGEILPCPEGPAPYVTSFGRRIRDTHYYGPSTFEKVLVKSMNSGMAHVAERISHRDMRSAIRAFGFGTKTSVGLPGEIEGSMTSAKDWTKYTQTSVAFGHEIAITPLQMVRAFCVFARDDGTMPGLRLLAVNPADDVSFVHEVLPRNVVKATREAMRKVMTDGTGRKAQSPLYSMFAKSGTPQLPKKEGGGYHEDRYMPSFIAGAPFDDPRIVVLCVIDDPDKKSEAGHFGGAVAGPIVTRVIDASLAYLGVEPDIEQETEALAAAE